MPKIVVTGATGHTGRPLAEELLRRGISVVAIARHAHTLTELRKRGADIKVGDLDDSAFLTEAFKGADAVYAMVPGNLTAPNFRAAQRKTAASVLSAIRKSGVKRVVLLSSIGGGLPEGTGPIVALHEFEEELKKIPGVSSVALRPTYFMENFLQAIPLIKEAGVNGSPALPDRTGAMVATRDIAAVAADLLADPTFTGHTVRDILGPRDYDPAEATHILGEAIGKPDLAYVQFKDEEFKQGLVHAGLSPSVADSFLEMHEAMNAGTIQGTVRRTPENSTPTTLETFSKEVFAPAFRRANAEAVR